MTAVIELYREEATKAQGIILDALDSIKTRVEAINLAEFNDEGGLKGAYLIVSEWSSFVRRLELSTKMWEAGLLDLPEIKDGGIE